MPASFKISIVCLFVLVSPVKSADVVRLLAEGARNPVGTITEISATEVKILRTGSSAPTVVSAVEIAATQFDQEPPLLTAMRTAILGSRFSDVLEMTQRLDPATIGNPFARQDYDYFRAFALGQIALTLPDNAGPSHQDNLQKAIAACTEFLRTHPKSYHYFPICELTGELYQLAGNRENAFQSYSLLAKAPWPVFRLKAALALGTIRLDEEKFAEAEKFFASVRATAEQSEDALRAVAEAEIGLAKCLIRQGDFKTAIEQLEGLSMKGHPEDARLQAAIHLTLGEAYEAAANPKEAILAYLHVEILYPSAKAEYRSALKRLAVLWTKVNRPERAAEAEKNLREMRAVP